MRLSGALEFPHELYGVSLLLISYTPNMSGKYPLSLRSPSNTKSIKRTKRVKKRRYAPIRDLGGGRDRGHYHRRAAVWTGSSHSSTSFRSSKVTVIEEPAISSDVT